MDCWCNHYAADWICNEKKHSKNSEIYTYSLDYLKENLEVNERASRSVFHPTLKILQLVKTNNKCSFLKCMTEKIFQSVGIFIISKRWKSLEGQRGIGVPISLLISKGITHTKIEVVGDQYRYEIDSRDYISVRFFRISHFPHPLRDSPIDDPKLCVRFWCSQVIFKWIYLDIYANK